MCVCVCVCVCVPTALGVVLSVFLKQIQETTLISVHFNEFVCSYRIQAYIPYRVVLVCNW